MRMRWCINLIVLLGIAAATPILAQPFSQWTPARLDAHDNDPVELGVKFSSAQAVAITAIKFFKSPGSTSKHTVSLWTASGTRLAGPVTSTNETASGWQTVNLPMPVAIMAGTTYVASYHTVDYAYTSSFFNAAYTSGPLTAAVGAGVYSYSSTSIFPNQVWNNSNYWVGAVVRNDPPPPVSGVCGVSNGGTLSAAPTAGLCSAGSASAMTGGTGHPWAWWCVGNNGGSTAACSANYQAAPPAAVNSVCGAANGLPTTTAPATDLCTAGTASSLTGTGPWKWSCAASDGGATASCSAPVQQSGGALIPRDRVTVWNPGVTYNGGIPNRTTVFTTISPSGGDDTATIQAALDACPANQVVQLTAGVFKITGNGLYFRTSHCTLRGAGPGNPALNTGINTVQASNSFTESCVSQSSSYSIYCIDPSATQLVKADIATNATYGILYVQPRSQGFGGNSSNLAADAVKDTNTLTLASWPSPDINVGDYVLIDINTDNDPDVVWGPVFGPPGDGTRRWFCRQDRSISQIMEVTEVDRSSKTVTFSTPFHITFPVAYQAQLTQSSGPFLKSVGIENLFLWGGQGGDGHGDLAMWNCAYCWVKNVQATWARGTTIGFYGTFRSELRDSYIHESSWPNPGGGGYLTGLNTGASDNLFENNIMWRGNKEVVMRGTGGGNVLAYNYMDDSFDNGPAVIGSEGGANAGHFTTPHMELLEGNYSQNYKGDSYWGSSIYITAFRNQFSGLRAAHAPLGTYIVVQGNCHYPYGDWTGRQAVDVQAYTFYGNFVGNVLGFNGQTLLTEPYTSESCFDGIQQKFLEQVTAGVQASAANNVDAVEMWRFGAYQAAGWSYVDSTINTQLRQGNWDWVTRNQHWYGIGGTTDGAGGTPQPIPNSLYLSSKPVFFGSDPWPWIDPTTGTTYVLPAKHCFERNQMPTCLQNRSSTSN